MMYPILCKVKFETLHHAFRKREIWVQILFSVFVNWIIAPFLMVMPVVPSSSVHMLMDTPSLHCRGPFYRTSLVSEKV